MRKGMVVKIMIVSFQHRREAAAGEAGTEF